MQPFFVGFVERNQRERGAGVGAELRLRVGLEDGAGPRFRHRHFVIASGYPGEGGPRRASGAGHRQGFRRGDWRMQRSFRIENCQSLENARCTLDLSHLSEEQSSLHEQERCGVCGG